MHGSRSRDRVCSALCCHLDYYLTQMSLGVSPPLSRILIGSYVLLGFITGFFTATYREHITTWSQGQSTALVLHIIRTRKRMSLKLASLEGLPTRILANITNYLSVRDILLLESVCAPMAFPRDYANFMDCLGISCFT
jgi:hypothetical protein